MPDNNQNAAVPARIHRIRRFRGRFLQVRIFLVKFLRLFVYQSDWKVLPMSMLVAGLVAIVIRDTMFVTMEGTLIGSFALACVSLWNGCFNSIQNICRERNVIKREHRSGMHISSYIASHVLYQALLCLVQTCLALYIFHRMGLKIPAQGFFFSSMKVDLGVSIFLVTFSADMLSLLISSLVHTTTAAMTLMPFVLIFQLVFSGGVFKLPAWGSGLTSLTISGNGLKCIAAQADYNSLPMVSGWNSLFKMRNETITINTTPKEVMDVLESSKNSSIKEFMAEEVFEGMTVRDVVHAMNTSPDMQEANNETITASATIGEIIDYFGEEQVRNEIMSRSSQASQVPDYEKSKANIAGYWFILCLHAFVYTLLSIIFLEFIDKDKR